MRVGQFIRKLTLKCAAEEDNLRVKNFLPKNGFTLHQQEQIIAAVNDGDGQSTSDVEENKADSDVVDREVAQFSTLDFFQNSLGSLKL